jgi:hypothetical protein
MVAWDDGQDQRIYVLRPLPDASLDKLPEPTEGRRPDSALWPAPQEQWEEFDRIMARAGAPSFLVRDYGGSMRNFSSVRVVPDGPMREHVQSLLRAETVDECLSDASYATWLRLMRVLPVA